MLFLWMQVYVCELVSFPNSPGMVVLRWKTALKYELTAFLWQMSTMAVLARQQVHAQKHTHTIERGMYFTVYTLWIEKATTFPGCCRPFRGRSPQGQVIRNLTLYSDEIGAILLRNGLVLQHIPQDLCLISWPCFGRLRLFVNHSQFILHCT